MNDLICGRTFQGLENLYLNSKYFQENFKKDYYIKDQLAYLKEVCTIKLCGPRRSGNTSSIFKLAQKYNMVGLVVYPNNQMANRFTEIYGNNTVYISNINNLLDCKYNGLMLKFIAVDGSFALKDSDFDEIYKKCLNFMQEEFYLIIV